MLRDLNGPQSVRKDYIKEVIKEAGRFKRKNLVELLKTKMDELTIVVDHKGTARQGAIFKAICDLQFFWRFRKKIILIVNSIK